MATISANAVKDLREKTGAGMMDAKKALEEAGGDFEKAVDILRQKGLSAAAKKAARVAAEGTVAYYIHMGGKIGVMVEVNSETDFVAKNPDFQQFAKDVAMHIAAANPQFLSRDTVPADVLARERAVYEAQAKESGKPAAVIGKIVEGKLEKFYADSCLMEQVYIKDPDGKLKIKDLLNQMVAKIGENIVIRRFVRYQLGEGIEKKKENFAEEVAAQLK
jgi:elongation factor Ts